jgi:methionyl-tRNA formyltransferase
VVVAYGHILPQAVVDFPRLGTLNIHASLLPKLRGAAPIQGAILEGLTTTGVSIMRMVPALDAGPVILQVPTPIADDETYGELSLRMSELGALALIQALALIEMGEAAETVQEESEATYAPKITREMTRVDWSADARMISRLIRAYDPRPGAYTTLRDTPVKLYGARYAPATTASADGEVIGIDDEGMLVACGMGAVRVAAVHPAGRKRMTPAELARGNGVAVGDRLS